METCKKELEKYKARERDRYTNYTEFYRSINEEIKKLQENCLSNLIELSQNSHRNLPQVVTHVQFSFKDRHKAIEELMKTLMQFALPVSHKYLLYAAENAAESSQFPFALDSKKTSSQEYFTSATRRVETYGYELMKEGEVRQFLKESALNFKRCMQKFLRCEREIQKLTVGLDQYIFERILPALEPHKAFDFIKWASTVLFLSKCRCTRTTT